LLNAIIVSRTLLLFLALLTELNKIETQSNFPVNTNVCILVWAFVVCD